MPMLNSLSALTDEIVGRLYADYPFLDRRAQRLAVLDAAHSAVIFGIDSRREAASAVERAARQQLDGLVRRSQ